MRPCSQARPSLPIGTMADMQAVMLEVPEALLAERRRLGHNRFDEMWEGVLHIVPPPSSGHQCLEAWLVENWAPLARARGLRVTTDTGLFDPAIPDYSSYRQPYVAIFAPSHATDRGIEGRAELVVEVRSPNDEAHQKLAFYERVGAQEILVIELDFGLRHWARDGDGLTEITEPDGASAPLRVLPVVLYRSGSGTLAMKGPFGEITFEERAP